MTSVAAEPQQNVVVRVANLPLVRSTCDLVSSAYISTKENHPNLKPVCEIAEKGVKNITAVTLISAKPILEKLEPQIALANNYACISLDKIEEKLPILLQPTNKAIADMVAGAKEAVTGAKDTVAHTITGVVDKTKGAAQESMEMTKAVVTGSINTVLGSHMVQVVSTGVDAALTKSEAFVDHYLPLTEEEAAKEATRLEAGTQKPSYYIRLGSLSSKVRRRAYEQALTRIKDAKGRSLDVLSQLHHTSDLMKYAYKNLSNANKRLHEAQDRLYQSWVAWRKSTGQDGEASSTEMVSSFLAIALDLSHQLQTTSLTLVSGIQDQAYHTSTMARNIYQKFHSASFRDVSDQLLTTSKGQVKKMKESLADVVDYFSIPLNWLVGPFYPWLQHGEETSQQDEA
ncbi:perilipin-2-like isoform X2 [Rhinatrema bivittatum]|uniref:perilipin-2-like isoform X2 n=1 Tax=Rhinatrema bivittatum TaxID=194408 RepID=UPI00112DCE5D|nr:perilipin-2-like isoform X2 [Rhinatrema bivittatum]